MVTQPQPKDPAPALKVTANTLNPADLEGYLTAFVRVEAIARLKFKIRLSVLIALPMVQAFLSEQQGITRHPIERRHLAELHWLALIDWLQQKPTQAAIREIIPTLSEADRTLPPEPSKGYLPKLTQLILRGGYLTPSGEVGRSDEALGD